ncbi:MAG: hypothetical protein HOM96_02680 [Rickettsiales bacterium]|jgi:gas vesicle protein|nr:hypothetical protein [Rickettsiales bacterium]
MKFLILIFSCVFSLTVNSFAFDLEKTLDKLKDDAKGGGISLDSLADDITNKVTKKLEGVEDRVEQKVKSYEEKLDKEIKKGLSEITQEIEIVKTLKARADRAIMIAKIIGTIFSFSFLFLIFLIWRMYRKIKGLYKLMDNVRNYKDIEKRIAALEQS